MNLKKILLFLCIIPLLSFTCHKYYLSLTQIEYDQKTKAVQIIINVFMDDIETALNNDFSVDLKLNTKKELKENDVYFKKYLKQHLQFKINKTPKNFTYLGKEYDGDLVYFYLEIENIDAIKTLEIDNSILIAHFSNQQNLVKSKVDNVHKSIMLSKEKQHGELDY